MLNSIVMFSPWHLIWITWLAFVGIVVGMLTPNYSDAGTITFFTLIGAYLLIQILKRFDYSKVEPKTAKVVLDRKHKLVEEIMSRPDNVDAIDSSKFPMSNAPSVKLKDISVRKASDIEENKPKKEKRSYPKMEWKNSKYEPKRNEWTGNIEYEDYWVDL